LIRKHPLYPRKSLEDWWTPAKELFKAKDVLHRLRHYNKRAVPADGMRVVRQELMANGGLQYREDPEGYAFVRAMAK
jgi:hypothetical protein